MRSHDTLLSIAPGREPAGREPTFAYYACLRIFSEAGLDFERLASTFGVAPTLARRRGEGSGPNGLGLEGDLWLYRPSLAESEPLYRHVDALWAVLRPHVELVRGLKLVAQVQVLLGFSSNVDHAGLSLPSASLQLFSALELPLELSVVVLPG
jgi:hypothetical protein